VVEVNLETLQIKCGDFAASVSMGDGPRQMLCSGTWDACGQLVANAGKIQETANQLPYLNWAIPTPRDTRE
ncbi:MAG: hypothetical protein WA902_05515, partial [Thermosynechococcaceae cyanobacterium]